MTDTVAIEENVEKIKIARKDAKIRCPQSLRIQMMTIRGIDAATEREEKGINARNRMNMTAKRGKTMTPTMDTKTNRNPKGGESAMNQRRRPRTIRSISL